MSIFSKLACCCSSSGRKAPEIDRKVEESEDDDKTEVSAGQMDIDELQDRTIRMMAEKYKQNLEDPSEMAKIRDVAYNLIKKATIDIVHTRIINKIPNDAFAPVLGGELGKIATHPEFAELIKIIVGGPTTENRMKAEKHAYNIANFLIEQAEKEVPMTLGNE